MATPRRWRHTPQRRVASMAGKPIRLLTFLYYVVWAWCVPSFSWGQVQQAGELDAALPLKRGGRALAVGVPVPALKDV